MSKHGPQFDEFTAQSGEHHGGAEHDEFHGGPAANAGTDAVTQTYRDVTANGSGHGKLWDEFGWTQMPEHYGRMLDSNFQEPVADGGGHGTYFDVFRGGDAEVRVDVDGKAGLEARVIECHPDHAVIELRGRGRNDGGGRREVNIGQIREWRRATASGQASETRKPTAHPGNTPARDKASTAEAPSAHNATARGGGRSGLDATQEGIFTTVKTDLDDVDVAKTLGELRAATGIDVAKTRPIAVTSAGAKRANPYCGGCAPKVKPEAGSTKSPAPAGQHTCTSCGGGFHVS